MIEIEKGMIFESTGRKVNTHGCPMNSMSIGYNNTVNFGYDGYLWFEKEDNDVLTKEERKEISEFMINLWTKFAL